MKETTPGRDRITKSFRRTCHRHKEEQKSFFENNTHRQSLLHTDNAAPSEASTSAVRISGAQSWKVRRKARCKGAFLRRADPHPRTRSGGGRKTCKKRFNTASLQFQFSSNHSLPISVRSRTYLIIYLIVITSAAISRRFRITPRQMAPNTAPKRRPGPGSIPTTSAPPPVA